MVRVWPGVVITVMVIPPTHPHTHTRIRIPLVLAPESASLIGGLRQAVDDMLVRMATDPTLLTHHSPYDDAIIQAVGSLVSSKATPPSLPQLPPGG